MAGFGDDPHKRVLEGSQKYGHKLDDLQRAQENARHAQSFGAGRSRRWLWLTVMFIVAIIAVIAIYQFAGPSDATLPPA